MRTLTHTVYAADEEFIREFSEILALFVAPPVVPEIKDAPLTFGL